MATPNITSSIDGQMHNNIMTAGSRDRPPMLAPGRYPQWHSRFLRYVDTRPNGEALRKCILSGPYKSTTVLVHDVEATDNSLVVPKYTTVETPANMSPENKAHFLAENEAIHLILTGIGDNIYLTVDACQTTQEMLKSIERLQQGQRSISSTTSARMVKDKDMQKNLALIAKEFNRFMRFKEREKRNASEFNEEVPTMVKVKEPQPQSSPIVHAGPNLEHMDLEAIYVSTQLQPEQMDERFTTIAYPNVHENLKLVVKEHVILEKPTSSTGTLSFLQHLTKDLSFGNLFFNDKPFEAENKKTIAETEAE
nr:hypothetical protein [Tanacetum cinerariifolium]